MVLDDFFVAFFSIFVIMDAIGNVPLFWSMSKNVKKSERDEHLNNAIIIATIVLVLFIFLGEQLLNFFNISLNSFKIAGGIIVLLVGLEMVIGLRIREQSLEKYKLAVVPLATPIITGPGVITTALLLVHTVGIVVTLAAALLNLVLTWFILKYSHFFHKYLGRQGADVLTRIMGLILTAIAVEFIRTGWV